MFRRLLNRLASDKPKSFSTPPKPLEPLPNLVLYQFPQCPYCRRVLKVIDELDLDIPYRNTRLQSNFRTDLIQRTGRSQVPCLFINGKALFESLDIVAYLKAHDAEIPKKTST